MNCTRVTQVLDAYLDGELDRATADDIAQHVAGCAACASRRTDRHALSRRIREEAPYFEAPEALRQRVVHSIAARHAEPVRMRVRPTWLQAGAFAFVLALMSALAGYWYGRPIPENPLVEQVIASHVASLAAGRRLTDVESTDRHVVKPWFQGKVDFAPVVRDLSADGYALLGARLDHVADRQAVAVVYRVRSHVINLYVWRSSSVEPDALTIANAHGFGVATWAGGGLRFAAVSDVDRRDLERFAQLIRAP